MKLEDETQVIFSGDWEGSVAQALQNAFLGAMAMEFKIPNEIRYMDGMSGRKYRALINNLVEFTDDARYLEVGSHAGSTACSAIYGNSCAATCIDNWSEFGGPKELFHRNITQCLTENIKFNFIEKDFRDVDYANIGKFNIYMFDGPHGEQDQCDGVTIAQDALDDIYTLIVDDWNNQQVRNGTQRALEALEQAGQKVIARLDIFSNIDNGYPERTHQYSDWHNGYVFMVMSKK